MKDREESQQMAMETTKQFFLYIYKLKMLCRRWSEPGFTSVMKVYATAAFYLWFHSEFTPANWVHFQQRTQNHTEENCN